ncbi:DUF1289 domain-containing protein [Sphingomonas donggukensis]|uniref:DUF1289 domain-containing protein n=1 Tax=Sphingomonas donggukensis TaxID=2949093 RepID=A0ABY4TW17_9SPHN|nr:DUF1289 domain-containing protein [Sphingomonas donggukensis]URW76075.1 DUF1289 domain-containing protein [Sphingomonas donggukensis]
MTDDVFDYCEPARVMSPCVNVCALDPATGWCTGCGRTGAEIAAWSSVTDAERQRILDRLPPRIARLRAE